MQLKLSTPLQSLSSNHKKDAPFKEPFEQFVNHLKTYLDEATSAKKTNKNEGYTLKFLETFLSNTHYPSRNNFINSKELKGQSEIDLAIYANKKSDSNVEVIIEAKTSQNKAEMLSKNNVSAKALCEAIHYYLYEKINFENNNIKHIIITNYMEWYVFDATEFRRLFYQNKTLKKQFKDWYGGNTDDGTTNQMYESIGQLIKDSDEVITCTHIDLENLDFSNTTDLKSLYKFLSPRHLLKKQTVADSNSLDKNFYHELLHIMGLEQTGKSKKIITRKTAKNRELGSLLENVIVKIQSRGILRRLPNITEYGDTENEQLFNLGLELCLTWVNRILFLKLLESQLISYHNGNDDYAFLSSGKIKEFDELETLFFEVLAIPTAKRGSHVVQQYPNIPYLNSSLFEPTKLEDSAVYISGLKDKQPLTLYKKTVLKNEPKKELSTLDYLLRFLDAYDFGVVGKQGDFKEESKTLISASVLGLIFEKINGYKEGSFYTPSFITMYMCKETIRKSVIQKMNDVCGWDAESIKEVKYKIDNKEKNIIKANEVINSITICDPAVGSGHFLVSALNELIQIKADLRILVDENGDRLDYKIDIENDELTITDDDGDPLNYGFTKQGNIKSAAHRIQKTIFYEKKTLIENCLFGVDINPNSVKICQLRLWIELLKNTFYTKESGYKELETLPNIDINIKCGNSLISRFRLEDDLTKSFKGIDHSYKDYKDAVKSYKVTKSKDEKHKVLEIINDVKNNFKDTFDKNAIIKRQKIVGKYEAERIRQENLVKLFAQKLSKQEKAKLKKLKQGADSVLNNEQQIKNNVVYKNAFEWRFEFPEVLDDKGKYLGFDCVIGNPPYMRVQAIQKTQPIEKIIYEQEYEIAKNSYDLANLFFEKAIQISNNFASNSFIFPHKFFNSESTSVFRDYLTGKRYIDKITHFGANMIFDDADTYTCIAQFSPVTNHGFHCYKTPFKSDFRNELSNDANYGFIPYESLMKISKEYGSNQWVLFDNELSISIFNKIYKNSARLKDKLEGIFQGIATSKDDLYIGVLESETNNTYSLFFKECKCTYEVEKKYFKPILRGKDVHRFSHLKTNLYVFFPYDIIDDKESNITLESLKNNYPLTYKYVSENEKLFKARESGKAESKLKEFWFGYIYPKNLTKFDQPKLSNMEICTKHPNVSYNLDKLYHNTKVYSWVKKKTTKESYEYLLAIANSKVLWWFILNTGDTLQGNARTLKTNYLNPFPIPKVVSKDDENAVKDKVKELLSFKKENPRADATELESQLDQLVYQLYNLTDEEIQIIESSLGK